MDFTALFPLFTPQIGVAVLAIYAAIVLGLTYTYAKGYHNNKESYLVARRELGLLQGSMSIGAAWVWAPGMFIAAQQAYQNGFAGLFWFTIGNFLTLILFGYFAKLLRERKPNGFTISGYLKEKFSGRVQALLVAELTLLAICGFAINVLAGSKSVELLTGIDYHLVSVMLALIALAYTLPNGLKASVVTEVFKLSMLWIGLLLLVPAAVIAAGGLDIVTTGMGGITGQGHSIFSSFGWGVFVGVGFATAMGHMGAPWGDNSFYQRAFAIKKESVHRSFIQGALIFLFIPLLTGTLGFIAAGLAYDIPKELVGYTNLLVVGSLLPSWAAMFYLFILFAGLVSVLDSQLASIANIFGHDVYNKLNKNSAVSSIVYSRVGMLLLIVAGLTIANWPGMTLQIIFLFFGILRACVWLPIMFSLWKPNLINETGMFWGILLAYLIGFPIYVYGQNFGGGSTVAVVGTMLAVFGSGILCVLISRFNKNTGVSVA